MTLSPASATERAAFTEPLYIQNANSLDGIEEFVNVEQVQILGCDIDSLEKIASLPKLKGLQLLCTPVKDLSPLQASKTLLDLEVNFTFVEDIAPLLEIPQLHWVKLYGNPLSDRSFNELLPQLREKEIPNWGKPPTVEASAQEEWEMARKIWDAGTGRCYGYIPRNYMPTLVRPGCGHDGFAIDFFEMDFPSMREALQNPKWKDYGIFHKFGTKLPGSLDHPRERFCESWLAGNHKDASLWADKDPEVRMDGVESEHYFGFISRFAKETFFLDKPWYVDQMQREHKVKLPDWFRRVRTLSLAGVRPTAMQPVEYELKTFAKRSLTREGGRYKIGYRGYYHDQDRAVYHDKCGMFPVGDITTKPDLGQSMLAINLSKPDDHRIYEFWPQSIHNAVSKGEDPMDLFQPVFATWGEMLEATTAIIDGDKVIPAVY